ncbi:hypothetical protein ACTFIR_004353 [Dictyostelium discoideum]
METPGSSSTPEQNLLIEEISDTSSTSSICELTTSQQHPFNINHSNPSIPTQFITSSSSLDSIPHTPPPPPSSSSSTTTTTSLNTLGAPTTTTTPATTVPPPSSTTTTTTVPSTTTTTTTTTAPITTTTNNISSSKMSEPLAAAIVSANGIVTTNNNNAIITFQRPITKPNSITNGKSNSSGSLKDGVLNSNNNTIGGIFSKDDRKPEPTKLEKMITSVKADNMVFLAGILKTKPVIPLTVLLSKRDTLLHVACRSKRMVSVIFLLEKTKGNLVNSQNDKLKTPFFICCENGFYKAATLLLDQGASPLLSNYQKWTPLHKLCSLDLPKELYNSTTDSLIGYSPENHLDLVQKIFTSLERLKNNPTQIIASRTMQNQTPLHLSLISRNNTLSKYLLTHSTVESLRVKDDNGNTVLHILAYKYNSKTSQSIGENILRILSDGLSGEQLQDYIDDVNNSMASALQIAMKDGHTTLSKLIVKYRAQAESKVLESFFTQLEFFDPLEITTRTSLDSIIYNDDFRQNNSFGKLITRIIIIIKQHYTINMSHQNVNILLKRAKDTLSRLFNWLDTKIDDHQFIIKFKDLIFNQIYDTIIHLYQETNKSKDLLFQQRVNMFKDVEYNELDISESSWEKNVDLLPKAFEILSSLQNKKTPTEKIETLNEATMQISRTDANDLTPMFMYLLIKSQIEGIQSQFQFMNDFKETPEQEQYLVLLQGSLDYLDTLNVTLRNSQNQIMSLSGIVERTIDNLLSLLDEFQNQPNYNGADQIVDDIDEGIQIADEIILLIMMLSKLSNRVNNDPIFLQLKWCKPVMQAYHFKAVIERLGLRLESDESLLIKTHNSNLILNNNSPLPNKIFNPSSSSMSTTSTTTQTNSAPNSILTSPISLTKQPSFKELSNSLPLINSISNNDTQTCNIINNNNNYNNNNNNGSNSTPLSSPSKNNVVCTTTTTLITTLTTTLTTLDGKTININNLPAGYICNRKGEICVLLEHPYPQMVYQIIEEKIREVILPKLKK